ncbi:hypothetical protein ACJRO7_003460 [Eucalyptus globulus]|uniref:Uncharacterized protein n=1 Tax=Eucalyptus globulus TaxID=34317 RepID=A0ABD3IWT2_EUCGL
MAEVLHSPSHFPSSPASAAASPSPPSSWEPRGGDAPGDASSPPSSAAADYGGDSVAAGEEDEEEEEEGECGSKEGEGRAAGNHHQLSLLALLFAIFRKSLVACKSDRREICAMEIGWPTNVRHVAHVTFDRFNGFLGLPVELEPEVPTRAPSASAHVFGVSTESMQLSYDSRGNSVPTILLLMQRKLYSQGGLQAEGIFRINAENSQEESVRDQLNRGVVPEGIDVHCLAGLIKAWFRELPTGVLDPLSPEQVMQCQTEEECAELVRVLPPTEAALLDWAVNLMADVAQMEHLNKMDARNIAMVFAPNMTQMADPLTALMYAVQVMNFLKMLILRTLQEREDFSVEPARASSLEPFDESGHQSPSQPCLGDTAQDNEESEQVFAAEEPDTDGSSKSDEKASTTEGELCRHEEVMQLGIFNCETEAKMFGTIKTGIQEDGKKASFGQSSEMDFEKGLSIMDLHQPAFQVTMPVEKSRVIGGISRLESRTEWIEAWR